MTTVAIETLGCAKNTVDSEVIMSCLAANGIQLVDDPADAEVVIINTCGFITPAKEESINTILELALLKENGKCKKLIVTGCMVGKYGNELLKELPEIDVLADSNDLKKIISAIDTGLKKVSAGFQRTVTSQSKYTRYLKIAEGCNNNCTYCTIPQLKGAYRSRPMEEIIKEAEFLVKDGARELVLIAQDTTRYGMDLYGKKALADLVRQVSQIEDLYWVRLLYGYPGEFTPELIQVVSQEPKVCKYLDIPLQHISDKILHRMGRRGNKKRILNLLDTLRAEVPEIAIRSTFIVGFPGETERDFNELLEFLTTARLDWVGAFTYWPEPDTPAALFAYQVSQQVKEQRLNQLMELQRRITAENNRKLVGRKMYVLIEGVSSDYPEYKVGRSERQAPEVDGVIYVSTLARQGEIVKVKITGIRDDYDLLGEDVRELGQ